MELIIYLGLFYSTASSFTATVIVKVIEIFIIVDLFINSKIFDDNNCYDDTFKGTVAQYS